MKRCFFTVCLMTMLLLMCTETNAQWKQLEVGPPGQVWSLGTMGKDVFAGTEAGIYRSTNQGKIWTNVSPYFARCFAVKGSEIFAGIENKGVIISTDSGETWTQRDANFADDVEAMAFKDSVIFAGGGGGMFKSTDDGSSWIVVENGLGYGQTTITGMVVTEGKVIASTFSNVVVSTDDGKNWSTLVGTNSANGATNCISVIDSTVLVGWVGGIIRSTDDGRSWVDPDGWINTSTTTSIVGDSSRIYAGTVSGVHVSTDDGVTWSPINNGLPVENAWYLARDDSSLFVASGDNGIFLSTNQGFNWIQASQGIRGWNGNYLAGSSTNIFTVLRGPGGEGSDLLYNSTDNGNTWEIDTSLQSRYIQSLTVTNSSVYAVTNSGIFESSDNGKSWDSINGGIMDTLYPTRLVNNGPNLIVSTQRVGEVYLSSDNGKTWENVGKDLPLIGSLAVAAENVYAGNEYNWTDNKNDGLYRSTDNGSNWSQINDTLTNITSLAANGSDIIAGRFFPPISPVDTVPPPPGGVFLSTDYGLNWSSFVKDLPEYPQVHSLAVKDTNVFVGLAPGFSTITYPGTFYTATISKGDWTNESHGLPFMYVENIYVNDSYVFVGMTHAGIWRIPLSDITAIKGLKGSILLSQYKLEQNFPNPFNPTTVISYQLSTFSQVRLDVYNVLGQKVVELVNKEEPEGTYKVTFNASNLASGVYFYRLIASPMGTHSASNFVDTKKLVLIK